MPTPSPFGTTWSGKLRRLASPSLDARTTADAALEEMDEFGDGPTGLAQSRAVGRLGSALWNVFSDHVALLDRDGVLVSVNTAWRNFALENGGPATAGLGSSYLQVCDAAAAEGEPEAAEAAQLVRDALTGVRSGRKLYYACADRWFSLQAMPIPGLHSGALVVHSDVTLDRQDVRHWRHRALHDSLTGLPNRALLEDRLAHALAGAARDPNSVAVLFLDLDAFKVVNDTLGHAAGDRVLVEAAARMAASVRSGDTLGRWGGDEFLVIAERLDGTRTAAELAERVASSMDAPILVGETEVSVGVSVGVAHAEPGMTPQHVIDRADQTLQDLRRSRTRGTR